MNRLSKLLLGFICVSSASQVTAELSIERIFSSPSLSGSDLRNVKISPDGQRVTFLQGKQNDYQRYDLWEYHIASQTTRILFDSDELHSGNENLSDEEKARRERMRLSGSGIVEYSWSSNGSALLFPLAGDVFYHKIGSTNAKRLLNTPEFETDIKFSPKGNFISFIREQNLYVMNIETGQETALTKDGGGDIKYGMAEFVAQEEMSRMTGYWWSPDESYIAFTRVDEAPVMTITRSEIYADTIKTISQKYPKAGSDNVEIQLAVMNLSTKKTKWVDLGKNKDIYLARAKWLDSQRLSYQIQSRDQKRLDLMSYNVNNATQSVLLTETSPTWVNLHKDLKFLPNDAGFIWSSERDGFKHLYHYSNDGKLIKQLTSGDWVVDSLHALNDDFVFFSGRKDTVLERHTYALELSTGKIRRLTELGYYHQSRFSADGSVFVNSASNITTPPKTSLHDNTGEHLTWLSENNVDKQHPLHTYHTKLISPEFGTFKNDQGVDLHYRLYKPHNVDTKRPVIVYVYGGPGVQVVTNRWGYGRGLMMQYWASQGYVVFSVDNQGSKKRGKAFEDPIYKNMGAIEVSDQVAGVEFLKTLPYVDAKRIGVFGHSYGGYMALMSMFKAPEHFAAGVSGAPVTDWRLYDTHYTERYMGDPRVDDAEYTASSVFPYAENLTGELLIYHGMADDNVLFTHSTMLYKHLQDRALVFDSMDYPGKKHSLRGKNTTIHRYKMITRFFDTHIGKAK